MRSNLTRIFFVLGLCLSFGTQAFAAYGNEDVSESSVYGKRSVYADRAMVKKFENIFSVRVLANYNYMAFASSQYDGGTLNSNRPVDVGFGLGLSDFTFDVKFSLPFTTDEGRSRSAGFDTGLDFFPGNLWMQLKYRRYSGLSTNKDNDGDSTGVVIQDADFRQRDMYLSVLWVKAGKDRFSVRAPYFLDRIQLVPAGSLIFGSKVQSTSAVDRAHVIEYYSKTRDTYSVWAYGGYSYTWVFSHNLFVNGWAVGGLAVGSVGSGAFGFFPEFNGKLAIGQWHQDWSWNAVPQITYSPSIYGDHVEQRLLGSFEILVVKRF